jgi:peroxiredoxin
MGVCGLLAACAALALACAVAGAQTASAPSLVPGKSAPQFVRTALDGQRIDLASLRGKVVLLNFWATWCGPCQVEMPVFAEWQRQYGARGLQVVGVSMDDDVEPVRRLVARLRLSYPVAMGDEKLGAQYGGVLGLPLTYLIGRDGRIHARFQGETDPTKILDQLKALLASR